MKQIIPGTAYKDLHNVLKSNDYYIDMTRYFKTICILAALHFAVSCTSKTDLIVSYKNPNIEYSGRIDTTRTKGADLYWSGTSMRINFAGESILALLEDERGDNYYNVIIDDTIVRMIKPGKTRKYHPLASRLNEGKHSVEIFKRTEWDRGRTTFYGFRIKGAGKILPKSPPKKRKLEFYGNSITAGYAVEDYTGNDSPERTLTNNYLSYAAITARHFGADYHCICKSGIGITISYNIALTMSDIYDRVVPEDSTSKWDFSCYVPDIVVINLFQNDFSLLNKPEREEFKMKFGTTSPGDDFIISSYKNFVSDIREHYPETHIICALGNMDVTKEGSIWPHYIEQAAGELNDSLIYTHIIPYKNTPGHPNIEEQKEMAGSLIRFISENIKW